VGYGRAHRLEQGQRALEVRGLAADHDRQRAGAGPDVAAGDGGVEDGDAALGADGGQLARLGRGDRAHVDRQRPLRQGGEDPVLARHQGVHGGAVGQHRDRRVRPSRRVGRAGRAAGSGCLQRRDRLRAAVGDDDLVAGGEQVLGHRPAHQPEPDEGDPAHPSPSQVT
jgi:hypothetical protein